MRLLDTNIIGELVRNPQGLAAARLKAAGDIGVVTSVIVAGELRYGCLKKGSACLTERVEAVLREIDVARLDPSAAVISGVIRSRLESEGQTIVSYHNKGSYAPFRLLQISTARPHRRIRVGCAPGTGGGRHQAQFYLRGRRKAYA